MQAAERCALGLGAPEVVLVGQVAQAPSIFDAHAGLC